MLDPLRDDPGVHESSLHAFIERIGSDASEIRALVDAVSDPKTLAAFAASRSIPLSAAEAETIFAAMQSGAAQHGSDAEAIGDEKLACISGGLKLANYFKLLNREHPDSD